MRAPVHCGQGAGVPIALEGALKFKEVAYLHTEGYPAGELKHGPFAMLSEETGVIALVLADEHLGRMLTAIREIQARGARVLAVAPQEDREIGEYVDTVLRVPQIEGWRRRWCRRWCCSCCRTTAPGNGAAPLTVPATWPRA
jgi:glutamine---fructose-6-phosphate transaminase (isomerizing)